MRIKKLKHCCMVIETGKARIVTDPGYYSIDDHDKISHADVVLITHDHADHFHMESVKAMSKRIPSLTIIANDSVGEMLAKEGVSHRTIRHGDSIEIAGVRIEAFGKEHAAFHKTIPPVSNVGYLIDGKLFYPGDAFTDPGKDVEALALPVAGPWMKISEAIDYALTVKPRVAFPVHDGLRLPSQHLLPEKVLGESGIRFVKLEEGGELAI